MANPTEPNCVVVNVTETDTPVVPVGTTADTKNAPFVELAPGIFVMTAVGSVWSTPLMLNPVIALPGDGKPPDTATITRLVAEAVPILDDAVV